MGRRGRNSKLLLGDLKEARACWKLKDEALDRALGELALEDTLDLSKHRLQNDRMNA